MKEFKWVPETLTYQLLQNSLVLPEQKTICLVMGVNESGKSHGVVDAVFRRMTSKRRYVSIYCTLRGILNWVSESANRNIGMMSAMTPYKKADCLIIDEFLANEREGDGNARGYVGDLLCDRIAENRQTIIITNRTTDELKSRLDPRLVSRVLDDERGISYIIKLQKRKFDRKNIGESWHMLEWEKPGMDAARFILDRLDYMRKGYYMTDDHKDKVKMAADEAIFTLNYRYLTPDAVEWMYANTNDREKHWLCEQMDKADVRADLGEAFRDFQKSFGYESGYGRQLTYSRMDLAK